MPETKPPISDKRMLQLMDYAIAKGIVASETEFLEAIEFSRTNLSNVKLGNQSFGRKHIFNACQLTGTNANWLFGFEANMLRKETKDPLQRLKEITVELEAQLKTNKPKAKR